MPARVRIERHRNNRRDSNMDYEFVVWVRFRHWKSARESVKIECSQATMVRATVESKLGFKDVDDARDLFGKLHSNSQWDKRWNQARLVYHVMDDEGQLKAIDDPENYFWKRNAVIHLQCVPLYRHPKYRHRFGARFEKQYMSMTQ